MTSPQAYHNIIARQLNISAAQVTGTLNLFAEGGTIPFIARYRKEATGSLDEVAILAIQDQHSKLIEIDKRREAIVTTCSKIDLKLRFHREYLFEDFFREINGNEYAKRCQLCWRLRLEATAAAAKEAAFDAFTTSSLILLYQSALHSFPFSVFENSSISLRELSRLCVYGFIVL